MHVYILGVLCCFALFVCLTLLASSFSSLIKTCTCLYIIYKMYLYMYMQCMSTNIYNVHLHVVLYVSFRVTKPQGAGISR